MSDYVTEFKNKSKSKGRPTMSTRVCNRAQEARNARYAQIECSYRKDETSQY